MTATTADAGQVALPDTQAEAQERAAAADKAFRTLQARLALRGFELMALHDGLAVARWGWVKHVGDLDAAQAFAETVGA